jgi:hypothetical protein
VSNARFWWQEGQVQRCLQENATNISWWQSRGTRYSGSPDTGEAFVQVAALKEGLHAVLDDRPPEAVLGRKPLVVDLPEGVEMLVQQPPQIGGLGIADPRCATVPAVQRQRLDTRGRHRKNSPAGQG